jgi:SAM-dependent methyltransferase
MSTSTVSPNYQYWRDNGTQWVDDYDRHKKAGPKYHICEFVICDYVTHLAPARVLEFGCGSGRHLRYLSRLPGVEVFGFDQSEAMVAGNLRWTDRPWVEQHITIGDPLQRLPYADASFELVFTAAVLVHCRPEHLDDRLLELMRVSQGQLLHIEPRPDRSHSGWEGTKCWSHDLVAAYARLGWSCVDLGGHTSRVPAYRALAPGITPAYTPSPVLLSLYDRLMTDLSPGG